MKGHNWGKCRTCGKLHKHPKGTLGKHLPKKNLDINYIKKLYFTEKLSLARVGKKLNVTAQTIRLRLIKAGYQLRGCHDINSGYTGKHHSKKTKEKIGNKLRGHTLSKKSRLLISKKITENAKNNSNFGMRGKKHTKKTKIKMSISKKQLWKDEEYRERMIPIIIANTQVRPTSFEQKIINLINKYGLPFSYVGDGRVIINYVNPDFIGNNGNKQIIEVYYSWFKINRLKKTTEQYERERRERFAKFGFTTLFLNENDLMDKDWEQVCLNKLKNFQLVER